MFRRNIHEAVDRQIKEAMLKPLTAENLNYLSDLYLRRGERELSIECLYNAITKLHVSQRDKMIAIYKKIIRLAPGDEKAYRGLIDIFAKMGLVAEEINHLILLAKVYQSRGDYEKVNELYRRVHLIAPDNETAAKYFGKGKPDASHDYDSDDDNEAVTGAEILPVHPGTGDLTGPVPERGSLDAAQDGIRDDDWDLPNTENSASDEVPVASGDWGSVRVAASGNKKVYLIMGIAVLLMLLVVAAGFFWYRTVRGRVNDTPGNRTGQRPAVTEVPQTAAVKQKESTGLRITVARLNGSMTGEAGLGKAVGPQAMAANQFYSVTLQADTGCIPEAFVRNPLPLLSFVAMDGAQSATAPVKGLELLTRTVNKATVQGCGENQAVFMKLFVAHPMGQQYKGIAVRTTEKGVTETLTWD